jgi:hypothetical protein
MKILRTTDEDRKRIKEQGELLIDFFELNDISPSDSLNVCMAHFMSINANAGTSSEDLKAYLDEFVKSYKRQVKEK